MMMGCLWPVLGALNEKLCWNLLRPVLPFPRNYSRVLKNVTELVVCGGEKTYKMSSGSGIKGIFLVTHIIN